jgi:tetratricopeptide (TPR) repeat protein
VLEATFRMTSREVASPPNRGKADEVVKSALRSHAARLTTVGGLLYQKGGDNLILAMKCLQEGVQAMMCLEDPSSTATPPPIDREAQLQAQLKQLLSERQTSQQERRELQNRKPAARKLAAITKDARKTSNVYVETAVDTVVPCTNGAVRSTNCTVDGYVDNVEEQLKMSDRKQTQDTCDCSARASPLSAKEQPSPMSASESCENSKNTSGTFQLPETMKAAGRKHYSRRSEANACDSVASNASEGEHSMSTVAVSMVPATREASSCATISLPSSSSTSSNEESRKKAINRNILSQFDAESNENKGASNALLDDELDEAATDNESTDFFPGGIPGLFAMTSRMKGAEKKNEKSMLVFSEPFLVDVDESDSNASSDNHVKLPLQHGPDSGAFHVPMEQCSRASLFNMGLLHYQWNITDSAMHFFELSLSLAQPLHALLIFDPIALASINNVGQILMQNGKVEEAKAMFSDALSRGNSVLVELNKHRDEGMNKGNRGQSSLGYENHEVTSGLLRRFQARSLMNMAQIQFYNCNYELATTTCLDAMRLLRPNMLEVDAAALWYNVALSLHHQNELHEALIYLEKFLDVAVSYLGVLHLQVATALHRKGLICYEMRNLFVSTKPVLQALRIRKMHLGKLHQLVADSLCLLGKIYLDREEFRFAQNALLQALSAMRAINEDDHLCLDIAQTLIDLGRACHSEGQLDEALKAYLEVVFLTRRLFGERHAYVPRIKCIVANIYLEQGEIERALEQFERVCRIRILEGLDFDYCLVQNPHVRVKFSHPSASASA